MDALQWFRDTQKYDYPQFRRGDIMLSMKRGNFVSTIIALFQKQGRDPLVWSHTAVYVGGGQIAEATLPKGGVAGLEKYMKSGYTMSVYRVPGLTDTQRSLVASEAVKLAPRPYDKGKLILHAIDNVIERFTWNRKTQSGLRPLSHLWKEGDTKNVCSELVERAFMAGAQIKFQDGLVGQARPADIFDWLKANGGVLVLYHESGELIHPR